MVERGARVYIETSVISGWGRESFGRILPVFLDMIRKGIYIAIVSEHTLEELSDKNTPQEVITSLETFDYIEEKTTKEMLFLTEKYMSKGIIHKRYEDDALHIAIATVLEVDYLVTWNMKHIANENTKREINKINIKLGYKPLKIRKPEEIM